MEWLIVLILLGAAGVVLVVLSRRRSKSAPDVAPSVPTPPPQPTPWLTLSVNGNRISWSKPWESGMILDWKIDDGSDDTWPNDFYFGGELVFQTGLMHVDYPASTGKKFAFRARLNDQVSNIVRMQQQR